MGVFLRQPPLQHKMLVLSLVTILASTCLALPNRQRYVNFKNFPVIGIKENPEEETLVETIEETDYSENIPRAARQVEVNSYTDNIDDVFVEEALYLTPADREQRAIENIDSEISDYQLDNFDFSDDESLIDEENERLERDGAHGSHGSRHLSPNRNSRRFQQSLQLPEEQDFRQQAPQEQRGGRQTGQIGAALGVLSNPPSPKGDYNFNFSNDDGSSRQESGAPDGIRGSYSFVSPEGEQVNVEYVADETGFHATGSHVPQAPPMPPHVQRLLDHLAKVNGLARL